ncbi:putative lipid II flippase FtsW [Bacillus pumilus]|uniref:putative lipid II flippase FtsW n=1 Tax=Bacillus pumilus TaxID=1408 RepID=UPI0011AA1E34|nr:putative lipid II flippase FtsW [Bacillus pumilus]MBU8728110.1 putative lipid II flippase FtsW [Bacillus pumilus]
MLKRMLKSYDYSLLFAIILISAFGLVMVYSSSMITSVIRYEAAPDNFFKKQLLFMIVGAVILLFTALVPYQLFSNKKFQIGMLLLSVFSLIYVYFGGHIAGNARSWIKVGPFSLQPAEFVKIVVIIYLAAVYAKKQHYIDHILRGVTPPIVIVSILCGFIILQPDYGTAFIIGMIALAMILCSGFSGKTLAKLLALFSAVMVVVTPFIILFWDKIFTQNRLGRFESFQDPFKDAGATGHQLINSYYAIGSGGFFGLGLGESVQKYGYLPEPHTDFIMAIISEELGFFGVFFVLALLGFIVVKGFYIARKCEDPFGSLLAIGISSMIAIQTCINLGGVSGLIPITGVTLPFISYGGSSIILLSGCMGILLNISMFTEYKERYKKKKSMNKLSVQKNGMQKTLNL